jgi:PAS domain-containing protein
MTILMIQALVDDPAFVKQLDGSYLVANVALAGALGLLDAEALIGRRDEDVLDPAMTAEIRSADNAAIDAGQVHSREQELAGHLFLWRRIPWWDENGQVIGVAGIARDITELRREAARCQESEELLGLAQEAGRIGIFEWQVPTATVRLSPMCRTLYGLADETWRASIFREDHVRILDLIETTFAEMVRELNAEFRVVRAEDGAVRWIEAEHCLLRRGEATGPGRRH